MSPPIKKRRIKVLKEKTASTIHDDSSSEPSFESPSEHEDDDDDDDEDDDPAFEFEEDEDDREVIGQTFRVPTLPSQESTWSSPGLGTQPPPGPSTTTFRNTSSPPPARIDMVRAKKKRKVSLSPTDSLARRALVTQQQQPQQLQQQWKAPGGSQRMVDPLVVADETLPAGTAKASRTKSPAHRATPPAKRTAISARTSPRRAATSTAPPPPISCSKVELVEEVTLNATSALKAASKNSSPKSNSQPTTAVDIDDDDDDDAHCKLLDLPDRPSTTKAKSATPSPSTPVSTSDFNTPKPVETTHVVVASKPVAVATTTKPSEPNSSARKRKTTKGPTTSAKTVTSQASKQQKATQAAAPSKKATKSNETVGPKVTPGKTKDAAPSTTITTTTKGNKAKTTKADKGGTKKASAKKTLKAPTPTASSTPVVAAPVEPTTTKTTAAASVSVTKPKKKKKKRSFQDDLLHMLFMSCRPYTIKMLTQQLKTNEASINFCMLSLVDKGWVVRKEFTSKSGSRSKEFYWANQEAKAKELHDSLQLVPPHEIQQAREELVRLQSQEGRVQKELSGVLKEPSTTNLMAALESQEVQVRQLEQRLKETHSRIRTVRQAMEGGGKHGSKKGTALASSFGGGLKRKALPTKPMCSKKLKKKINDMRLQWKKRKEKCMDFVDQLADGMEKKVKDVVNILELETDEMEGVTMPPKHDDA